MSAGFRVDREVFWGTNGAIEELLSAMAALAATRCPDTPLARFLQDERDGFSSGKVVDLDEWRQTIGDRERLLDLFDSAVSVHLRNDEWTPYGRHWLQTVMSDCRTKITAPRQPE